MSCEIWKVDVVCEHRQDHRNNVPAATPADYFHRAATVPLQDELLGQLDQRFGPLQQKIACGMHLLPFLLVGNPEETKECAMDFATSNENDLPDGCSLRILHAQLDNWHAVLTALPEDSRLSALVGAAKLAADSLCHGVATLLVLLVSLPVTTCSCERNISGLRRLKTYIRSLMGGERLDELAPLHTHYAPAIDCCEVLWLFFPKN